MDRDVKAEMWSKTFTEVIPIFSFEPLKLLNSFKQLQVYLPESNRRKAEGLTLEQWIGSNLL